MPSLVFKDRSRGIYHAFPYTLCSHISNNSFRGCVMGERPPVGRTLRLQGQKRVVRREAAVVQSHARARRRPCFYHSEKSFDLCENKSCASCQNVLILLA
jgi:hypothetical protein